MAKKKKRQKRAKKNTILRQKRWKKRDFLNAKKDKERQKRGF